MKRRLLIRTKVTGLSRVESIQINNVKVVGDRVALIALHYCSPNLVTITFLRF
jgi:hypothetical protein